MFINNHNHDIKIIVIFCYNLTYGKSVPVVAHMMIFIYPNPTKKKAKGNIR